MSGTKYDTGLDTWTHGDKVGHQLGDWHVFLGPCPNCGNRTFDYGGMWACAGTYCTYSAGAIVCNNRPAPGWWNTDVQVTMDGDSWCAVGAGFTNIQESPCGFGATPDATVAELRKAQGEVTGL